MPEKTPTNPYGIDWSVFDQWSKNRCTCNCGQLFSSHTELVKVNDGFICVARTPCPLCDKYDDVRRSTSTESEKIVLTSNDVQQTYSGGASNAN